MIAQRTQAYWRTFLPDQNYNTLVTIQPPMRNKYMFEDKISHFAGHPRIDGVFYSVEQNANKMGYHIHLMFNDTCQQFEKKSELEKLQKEQQQLELDQYTREYYKHEWSDKKLGKELSNKIKKIDESNDNKFIGTINSQGIPILIPVKKQIVESTKQNLAWAFDIKSNAISYYESIDSKVAVSRYVTKYMKGDQIHYNIY